MTEKEIKLKKLEHISGHIFDSIRTKVYFRSDRFYTGLKGLDDAVDSIIFYLIENNLLVGFNTEDKIGG